MNRNEFIRSSAILTVVTALPNILKATTQNIEPKTEQFNNTIMQNINFGEAHLSVTNIQRSIHFWRDIVGMQVRKAGDSIEVGTSARTLIVLHQDATKPKQRGYSGLYHVAIHLETEKDLAQLLLRLTKKGWRTAPTDHIVAKSVYVDDPDGITIEFAVETMHRVTKEIVSEKDFKFIDDNGKLRNPIEPLDVQELYTHLEDDNTEHPFPETAIIGHYNLHQPVLDASYDFYKKMDFIPHVKIDGQVWGDLGAGGVTKHRIAVNLWAGPNAPKTPTNMAGLKFMTVKYDTKERLQKVLANFPEAIKTDNGYWLEDLGGNKILIG
ncbi:MAG TPA: VOC family protein [Puia sp.]|nr:VOC family protein [Puia sp.]